MLRFWHLHNIKVQQGVGIGFKLNKKSFVAAFQEGRIGSSCKVYYLEIDEATKALDNARELSEM